MPFIVQSELVKPAEGLASGYEQTPSDRTMEVSSRAITMSRIPDPLSTWTPSMRSFGDSEMAGLDP